MIIRIRTGALLLAALSAPATAQELEQLAAPPAAQALSVAPQSSSSAPMLAIGTEVPLTLLQELSTKNKRLRVGDRFRLETSDPILLDGVTIIPVGTPAMGEITEVTNKGMWGRSGRFVARLLYMTVNGRRIRLAGEFDDKGRAGGAGAVAVSALVFLPAGFFMTGTSALLPPGTAVKGFIDEDVPLTSQQPSVAAPAVFGVVPVQAPAPAASPPQRQGLGNSRVRCDTCR